jgi:acetylornithine deacetylase/succinyl-diaminopimelate desuccinylase-like protein
MTDRATAIQAAATHAATPAFRAALAALIAHPTDASRADAPLAAYLDHITTDLEASGFTCTRHEQDGHPFLLASRIEDPALPTVLGYAHGDTVPGMEGRWRDGRDPWALTPADGLWFGRGIADNKGQYLVNLTALKAVIATRGALGFNAHIIVEMGEEIGSPGLGALCETLAPTLNADLFLSSDGPRLSADQPTVFLGARGAMTLKLSIIRREGGRHSGNFGGALANPGLEMAHALASISSATGAVLIPEWTPGSIPDATRTALAGLTPCGGEVDAGWGTPGLTPAERVHAWSSAEILAFTCGTPDQPVNAIPPEAHAWVQLRHVVGVDSDRIVPALRAHLDAAGFAHVAIATSDIAFKASQTPVDHPFAQFAVRSLTQTAGAPPVVLPSLGGSLPNDIFTDTLGLPAIWVPHSYPGCSQHAPNEHLPAAIFPDAVAMMTGLYWDIGAATRADLGLS